VHKHLTESFSNEMNLECLRCVKVGAHVVVVKLLRRLTLNGQCSYFRLFSLILFGVTLSCQCCVMLNVKVKVNILRTERNEEKLST